MMSVLSSASTNVNRQANVGAPFVLVPYDDLPTFGINYTRVHLRRWVDEGKSPSPVRLSEARIAWRSVDIHEWLANLPTGRINRSPPAKKSSKAVAKPRGSFTAGHRVPRTARLR